eukprot:6796516-Pyramimonas_sp.AAC.1
MDLLARREASFAVEPHESRVGFFNERTAHKVQSKKEIKSVKDLVHHREKWFTTWQDKTIGENGGS